MSKQAKLIVILSALLLFVLGFILYYKFIGWYLIRREGLSYLSHGVADQFKQIVFFCLILTAIPLSAFVLKLSKPKSILTSSGILLAFVIAAIFIKRFLLIRSIQKPHVSSINSLDIQTNFLLKKCTPEVYMFVALIVGYIVLLLLKKQKILFLEDQ